MVTTHKNLCTHCSVGCSVITEVANGVWIGQEPVWDSPINRGSHCCKGAAVRDDVLNERRLHGMEIPRLADALDGCDFVGRMHHREGQA